MFSELINTVLECLVVFILKVKQVFPKILYLATGPTAKWHSISFQADGPEQLLYQV